MKKNITKDYSDPDTGKSNKYIISLMGIFLVCLIFVLSYLDSAEYVHCIHLDICEFLEIQGKVYDSQKEGNLVSHTSNQYAFQIHSPIKNFNNSPLIENLNYYRVSIKDDTLPFDFLLLDRYINGFDHMFFRPSLKKESTHIFSQKNVCPSLKNFIASEFFKIIASSIITS